MLFQWLTLLLTTPEYIWEDLGQYHGLWCPGSLYHQAMNSHGIDNTIDSVAYRYRKSLSIIELFVSIFDNIDIYGIFSI